jgi:hypothetical protein
LSKEKSQQLTHVNYNLNWCFFFFSNFITLESSITGLARFSRPTDKELCVQLLIHASQMDKKIKKG